MRVQHARVSNTQYYATSGLTTLAATLYACVCGVPVTGLPAFFSLLCL